MKKNCLTLLGGLLLGLCFGAAVLFDFPWLKQIFNSSSGQDAGSNPVQVDQMTADFTLPGLDGQDLSLSDLRGRVVVLNFWASWCTPCVQEMPVLEQYARRYAADLVVLGVNMQESQSQVQSFIDAVGITYPIVLDEQGVAIKLFRVVALPDTYFIDPEGVVHQRHIGSLSSDQLDGYLIQLGVGE